jgi:hypothetical protein
MYEERFANIEAPDFFLLTNVVRTAPAVALAAKL